MAFQVVISSSGLEILKGSEFIKQDSMRKFLQQKLFAFNDKYCITEIISVQNVLSMERKKSHLVYLSYKNRRRDDSIDNTDNIFVDNRLHVDSNNAINSKNKNDSTSNSNIPFNDHSTNKDPNKSDRVINFPSDERAVNGSGEILGGNMMVIDDNCNDDITDSNNSEKNVHMKYMWIAIDILEATNISAKNNAERSDVVPDSGLSTRDSTMSNSSGSSNNSYDNTENSNSHIRYISYIYIYIYIYVYIYIYICIYI
jgi:hypothetical protein